MQKLHLAEILDVFSQAGVDLRQRVHELCHQQVNLDRRRIEYHHWNILQSSLLGHVCWGCSRWLGKGIVFWEFFVGTCFWLGLSLATSARALPASFRQDTISFSTCKMSYQSTCFVVINNTLSSWSIRAIGSRDILWKNSQPWDALAVCAHQYYCLNTVLL